jgi:Lipocalin-like domain
MQRESVESIRDELLGSWALVSWESYSDGSKSLPLGEHPQGQLMYTGDGHVSAQLVRADQQPFASDDWRAAKPEEMTAAWPAYFGYFGTFTVDVGRKAVTHHIESGWFPNLVGTKQVRHYCFDEGRLVLDADTAWGKVRIVWQRRRQAPVTPR